MRGILSLILNILSTSQEDQNIFISSKGLECLYPLVNDENLRYPIVFLTHSLTHLTRCLTLSIICLIGTNEKHVDTHCSLSIISHFNLLLKCTTGSAILTMELLEMRKDILAALSLMLEMDGNTRNFCETGGLVWIEDILISLPKQMIHQDRKNIRNQDSFFYSIQGVMKIMGQLEGN